MLDKLKMLVRGWFEFLFGKITWSMPPWVGYVYSQIAAKPKVWLGGLLGFIFFACSLFYAYHWYQSRPQPERVIAVIDAPNITPVDKILVPDVLTIHFGAIVNDELVDRSVAPLTDINKTITKHIHLTPDMPGKWTWDSDSVLIFVPNMDWPAGQTYQVEFDKPLFANGVKMKEWSYSFSTLPFTVNIDHFKLYIDPINPRERQAVADLQFNYPVDPASLENKIVFAWQGAKKIPYTIKFDEHKRNAYLRTSNIDLPSQESFLTLTLEKGIKPAMGPASTMEAEQEKILIADAGSYFKVSGATTAIVRNQKDRPEQVLALETTLGVAQDELDKFIHAYVLPQDRPATLGEEIQRNYQWENPGEVTPDILALSKPLTLNTIPADRDFATLHSYQYDATTPSYLYLKIDSGMKSMGEFALAKPFEMVLKVPVYPKEISFLHKGALLALGTEEKLSVVVRGLPAVKFTISRVLPDDVNHLITQTGGDFSNPYFRDFNFNQNNISEIFTQVQSFDITNPAKQQYTALDLGQYVARKSNPDGPLGLFLLQAQGWNVKDNISMGAVTNRLVLITDLGLIAKDNNDGSHDVFVQSITKGSPVANASVSILGKNGVSILTRRTDAEGRANFPSLTDYVNEREPTVYIVRNNNDVSFIPFDRADRRLNFSRFDIGGVSSNAETQSALTAFLFSDRGIYRPGDTAHVAMIVKQPYVKPQPAGVPLEVDVVDPRGTVVKVEKITLNDSGYLTFDFPTNATSPTGQYAVNLYIVKDNHPSSLIGSTLLNVAEFLPDRLRIAASLSEQPAKGWVSPVGLTEKVGLWNLYGVPAANYRIAAKILLTPKPVTFTDYPDYTFLDPLINPKSAPKVFSDTLPETTTNSDGEAVFDLRLDRFEKATYQLTVFTEGFEAESGRSVTTQSTVLVSPLKYLVGYKPDGDLHYIKQDDIRSVNFIAINPQLIKEALPGLTIQLFSLRPVTTLVKNENDTYEYKSIMQTTQVSSRAFDIAEAGTDFLLPAKDIGDYLVVVADSQGTELARFNFSIVGTSQQPMPKNAELNVKLSKTEFNAGDDIEMQMTAPYTGAGLITIERDKVYASHWFTTTTTSSMQKIHIPSDFRGNGYVNIAFVRDLNSPDIFTSPLSYSVMPFSVTHNDQIMHVDLTAPASARPGDSFTIQYKTDKPGKIIIYAVDEGILQAASYDVPDPLTFFFQKRALEVNTLQIVDQILPKFSADRELSAVGGDGGANMLLKNLNPFKRKTELPVVYWSGVMDTDTTSRQVVYQVPDYFNGTLHVIAVAVAANAVGVADKQSIIRGDFVISPHVPTFVAPGDEFEVTTSVLNNVAHSGDAEISIELSASAGLTNLGMQEERIVIPEGEERSVTFKVKANDVLGSADLTFSVKAAGKTGKLTSTVSVRPPVAYSTSISSGFSNDPAKSIAVDRILYPEFRKVEVTASTDPLILVTGLQRYLDDYPYGCVEQLVSKAFPWLVMANQPWMKADAKTIQDKIDKTIQMLIQRQTSSGGFSYWPAAGSAESDAFSSVYGMHFLTEAKLHGYNIPASAYSAGISYLKEMAARDVSDLNTARLTAYAIYILTRNEIITTNYVTNLQLSLSQHKDINWQADITGAYIAATYQLMKNTSEAEKLIAVYETHSSKNMNDDDFYNQQIANAQYLYLVALHFPATLQRLDADLMGNLVSALNDSTMSTLLSGYTALALGVYNQNHSSQGDEQMVITGVHADGKEEDLSPLNTDYLKVSLQPDIQQVKFKNPVKLGYFYQLVQAGFDKSLPTHTINDGIEVVREFTKPDNTAVSTIGLGDELLVHIHARATDNHDHTNTALVDLLPGGFEVVSSSINSQTMEYADVREDRVIFFGDIGPQSKEVTYRIKATNHGKYLVPPVFGVSMYNPVIKSIGLVGSLKVE